MSPASAISQVVSPRLRTLPAARPTSTVVKLPTLLMLQSVIHLGQQCSRAHGSMHIIRPWHSSGHSGQAQRPVGPGLQQGAAEAFALRITHQPVPLYNVLFRESKSGYLGTLPAVSADRMDSTSAGGSTMVRSMG